MEDVWHFWRIGDLVITEESYMMKYPLLRVVGHERHFVPSSQYLTEPTIRVVHVDHEVYFREHRVTEPHGFEGGTIAPVDVRSIWTRLSKATD